MDHEDEWGYYQAFRAVFDQAEKGMGYRIPFGHLTADDKASPTGSRVKAILVEEHVGQIKGLSRYFQSKYPNDEKSFHVLRIAKTCRVHYEGSIQSLENKNGSKVHQGVIQFVL
jgi:hypothetical protein